MINLFLTCKNFFPKHPTRGLENFDKCSMRYITVIDFKSTYKKMLTKLGRAVNIWEKVMGS